MTISRSQIGKSLIPGLNAHFGDAYGEIDNEHDVLYQIENSGRSFEEEVLFSGLGEAPRKREGEAISYDDMQEVYTSRYTHDTYALGFAVTEEALEDDLYDTFSKVRASALGRAMASTKQVKAAAVFNNGFSTDYAGGDGQPLFSSAHPTVAAGNQSNTVSADLSETALENATINISLTKDDRGILIGAQAKSLHIPPALKFTAKKILDSDLTTINATLGTDGITNQNQINAVKSMSVLPAGYHINHRFTDTNGWFIQTDVPNGTKHFVRVPLSTGEEGDFDTGNFKYKARERYSFGWSDWRRWYGSNGSS